MNNLELISNARAIYAEKEKYAYLYGAKGQIGTPATINALIAAEPKYFSKYSLEVIEQIKKFCLNKILVDCSGFVNLCTKQYKYSTLYYADSKNKTTPAQSPAGGLLYTEYGGAGRHIGIDIGHGFFIHSPKELHTIEIGVISAFPWEKGGDFAGIEYVTRT